MDRADVTVGASYNQIDFGVVPGMMVDSLPTSTHVADRAPCCKCASFSIARLAPIVPMAAVIRGAALSACKIKQVSLRQVSSKHVQAFPGCY